MVRPSYCRRCHKNWDSDEMIFCGKCGLILVYPPLTIEQKRCIAKKKQAATKAATKNNHSNKNSHSSSSKSSANTLKRVTEAELRWEMAAALEREAFFYPPGTYQDEKSKWAKLKHAAFIALSSNPVVNTHQHASETFGVGLTTRRWLKRKFGNGKAPKKRIVPTITKYPTISEALLIALNQLNDNEWINRHDLAHSVHEFYESPSMSMYTHLNRRLTSKLAFPLPPECSDVKNIAGWRTLLVLKNGIQGESRVRSRKRNKLMEYQLNEHGRELASRIILRASKANQPVRTDQWHGNKDGIV
jgi:hypothetical protein